MAYLLRGELADTGALRETFLLNQLGKDRSVAYTEAGDFLSGFCISGQGHDTRMGQDVREKLLSREKPLLSESLFFLISSFFT